MRLAESLRNASLGLATASFLFAGAAMAQTPPTTQPQQAWNQSAQTSGQTWHLVGVNARLDHTIETSSARQGQDVQAKLTGSVTTDTGLKLDKGTVLLGRIDNVQAAQNGGGSSLSIVFNRAKLSNGQVIPVKVTVLGAYPASEMQQAVYGDQSMGPAPRHVNPQERVDQESGLLRHVSMHSAVQSHDSATFRKEDGNMKLAAGTFLQVGIAPRGQAGSMNNGE